MDPLIPVLPRLTRMRKRLSNRIKEKVLDRKKSLNDLRKQKRQKIINQYRGIDEEWFQLDVNDDSDLNISDDLKSVQILIDYINGSNHINEEIAKKCFDSTKKFLMNDKIDCQEMTRSNFFQILSAFVSSPLIPNPQKMAAMDVIEAIISSVDIGANSEAIVKSGIILSIMISLETFDIELLIKTVTVMQIITTLSNDMLGIALNNGYLLFLMNIIKSIQVFRQRKSTQTNRFNRMTERKLILVQEISKSILSLLSMTNDLTNTLLILNLLELIKKLIRFKDNKIIANVLTSLAIIIERNPEAIALLDKDLFVSVTDLMDKNEEQVVSNVLHFWNLVWERIDDNCRHYSDLVVESKLLENLLKILVNLQKHRLIKEVANFLTLFMQKSSIGFKLLFESDLIQWIIKALICGNVYSQRQLLTTVTQIIARIVSKESLNYLIESQVIEAFAAILSCNDPNITPITLEAYTYIHDISGQLGLKECLLRRVADCNLNAIIESVSESNYLYKFSSLDTF